MKRKNLKKKEELLGEEISYIDCKICTRGDTNALSIHTLAKTKKSIV